MEAAAATQSKHTNGLLNGHHPGQLDGLDQGLQDQDRCVLVWTLGMHAQTRR